MSLSLQNEAGRHTHNKLRSFFYGQVYPGNDLVKLLLQRHFILVHNQVLSRQRRYIGIRTFHGTKYEGENPVAVVGGPGLTWH